MRKLKAGRCLSVAVVLKIYLMFPKFIRGACNLVF